MILELSGKYWGWKIWSQLKVMLCCSKKDRRWQPCNIQLDWNLFQNKTLCNREKYKKNWSHDFHFKPWCWSNEEAPLDQFTFWFLATSVGRPLVKGVCRCTYWGLQIAPITIFYRTNQTLSNTMEMVLNKVTATINNGEKQSAKAAGWVNLKQFTMRYQTINNCLCKYCIYV